MDQSSVLLVDDDYVVRTVISKNLRAANFLVTTVSSGSDAIRALQDVRYDVVITDLMMEGIDGFGVLEAVKKSAPLTAVIIITGDGDPKHAIDSIRLGADDLLVKPFELEELVFSIQLSLEKRNIPAIVGWQEPLDDRQSAGSSLPTARRLGVHPGPAGRPKSVTPCCHRTLPTLCPGSPT